MDFFGGLAHLILACFVIAMTLMAWTVTPLIYRASLALHGDRWRPRDNYFLLAVFFLAPLMWTGAAMSTAGYRMLVAGGAGVLLAVAILLVRRLYLVTAVLIVITVLASFALLPRGTDFNFFLQCAVVPAAWFLGLMASIRFDSSPADLWKQPRTLRPANCPKCNYDLAGVPGPHCPECGVDVWALMIEEECRTRPTVYRPNTY